VRPPERGVPRAHIDHLDLVVSDLDRSLAFYRELLAPLGWTRVYEIEGERGEPVHYLGGEPPERPIALSFRERQSDAHPTPYDRYAVGIHHICFEAPSRESVDERHSWLVQHGAEIESAPREYDYTPGYYAVFFYDPDGIKLEILHRP
jgi:glyoxylase I family protein